MKKNRLTLYKITLALSGIACTLLSFNSTPSTQQRGQTEESRAHSGKEQIADFRGVARKAIPAVVSIKVQTKKKTSALSDDSYQDPFDFFGGNGNDLWKFFGLPKRGESTRSQPLVGQGSGVIVSSDGYILTNSHVVNEMDSINILLNDGREFPAKVLGQDTDSDLALIKIDALELPYLTLGDSDELEVGQWVAAIGNPFGLQATLTAGVVSAKSRNNLDIVPYADFIQTDAAINRGNSGGPLLTLDGEVIGINTAIATNASSGYMGVGFAIPSNMAKHVMDEILSDGKVTHGFLGVGLQSIDYHLAQAFGLKKVEGALVTNVLKDSPAEKAGLQTEDIIIAYNGRPVENAATLRNAVYMMKPGTQIKLTILRKDQQIEVPVSVGHSEENPTTISTTQKNQLGIEVENLTSEIARSFGYAEEQGVIISKVNPNGVAAMAGLKKGALILSVNRNKVTNVNDYNKAVAETPKDRPVLLQVKQGDNYLYISLQTN